MTDSSSSGGGPPFSLTRRDSGEIPIADVEAMQRHHDQRYVTRDALSTQNRWAAGLLISTLLTLLALAVSVIASARSAGQQAAAIVAEHLTTYETGNDREHKRFEQVISAQQATMNAQTTAIGKKTDRMGRAFLIYLLKRDPAAAAELEIHAKDDEDK